MGPSDGLGNQAGSLKPDRADYETQARGASPAAGDAFPAPELDISGTISPLQGRPFDEVGEGIQVTRTSDPFKGAAILFVAETQAHERYTPPEQERVERLRELLGQHRYISVELQGEAGLETVHIVRPESHPDLVTVHVTTEKTMPSGARYSSLEVRAYLSALDGRPVDGSEAEAPKLDLYLERVEQHMESRAKRPLMVNVSPQGFHERDKRLVLGLTDTGGQDKFIEDMALVSAQLGFQVINVNRGGPKHPKLGDVREGMHYGADGVDLLFISDGNPNFVRKEDMFDEVHVDRSSDYLETLEAAVIEKGPCSLLAGSLLLQLRRENHPVALIGHYADGGETIRLMTGMMEAEGIPVPRVVHIPHSTGLLKKARLEADGEPVDEKLRIPHREHTERLVYSTANVLLSTSADMTASMEDQYGATVHGTVLIGVQTDRFHPREAGVERNDPRYDRIWQDLSEASGRPVEELQAAQLVLEYSRTAPAKDKATTIRAFAESCKSADRERILVINVADPKELKSDDEKADAAMAPERHHAEMLRNLVKELGVERNVVMRHAFKNSDCAQLCQLADLYISSAILEPWGMAVQEAAASGLPIVASTAVAIADELLVGTQRETIETDSGTLILGPAAMMFPPGNHRVAAEALNRLLNEEGKELKQTLAKGAYNAVIPACTWEGILKRLWTEHLGVEFRDGKVIVPPTV